MAGEEGEKRNDVEVGTCAQEVSSGGLTDVPGKTECSSQNGGLKKYSGPGECSKMAEVGCGECPRENEGGRLSAPNKIGHVQSNLKAFVQSDAPASCEAIDNGNGRDRPEQYECPFAGCGRLFPSLDFLLFHWPVHRLEETGEEEGAETSGYAGAGPGGVFTSSSTFPSRFGGGMEGGEPNARNGCDEDCFLFGVGAKRKHDHVDLGEPLSSKSLRPLLPNSIAPPPRRFTIPPALAPAVAPSTSSPPPSPTPPLGSAPVEKPESPSSSAPVSGPSLLGTPLVGGAAFPVPEQLKSRALQASRWLPLSTQPAFCRECLASPGCGSSHGAASGSATAAAPGSEQSQPPEVWNPPREEGRIGKMERTVAPPPDKLLREFMLFAELPQYVALLEDEWVTMSELPKLSDDELAVLGLPTGACKKLRRALLRFEREH